MLRGDLLTEMLYMPDIDSNYIREWDAEVVEQGEGYVVLDRSAFYPEGGGQPSDTGTIQWSGGTARVTLVTKKGGVRHHINGTLPEGNVHCVLDWDRRYAHMRMHTAQHIVSGVVYDHFGARTVGNQIHAETSRIDFHPARFDKDDFRRIEELANDVIARGLDVLVHTVPRQELEARVNPERCNLDLIPASVRVLRVIEIPGFDICPCAGTHVRSTGELGRVRLFKKESKGKGRIRITYELARP